MKTLKFLFAGLALSMCMACLENDMQGTDHSDDETGLAGTKWKLAALVDVQTRESIKPEPKDCNTCYTLEFDSDTTATGTSVLNTLHFIATSSTIEMFLMTEMGDNHYGNVDLFYEALRTLDTYEYNEEELKIYYAGKKKYLLFNSEPESVNPYRETIIGKWKLIQISTVYNSNAQNPEIIDCSSDNIIYDFLTNNRLEVSGGLPDDLSEGEHFYHYQKPNVGILSLPAPNLTIDCDNQLFCIAPADNDTMTVKGEKITGRVVDETGLVVEQGTVAAWIKTFAKLN